MTVSRISIGFQRSNHHFTLPTYKMQDLKEALGQYDIYRYPLEEIAPERKLYVAISNVVYRAFFTQDVTQLILRKHQLPIIIVDIDTEEILQWIN